MRRTWIGIGAAALLALAAVPATASAHVRRTARVADLEIPASNGYDAYISAVHQTRPNRHAHLFLALQKNDSSASYRVRALFTKRHLKASLGQFGRINLRFRPHGRSAPSTTRSLQPAMSSGDQASPAAKATERSKSCVILLSGFGRGTFHGRIRFAGENGYSRIHLNRADGTVNSGKISCSSGGGKRAHGTFLAAKAGSLEFGASHFDRWPKKSFLYALQSETVGRVKVERAAGNYRGGVFDFSPDFMTAHVEPSEGPLTGSADFAAPNQWTGDLTASFPGEPNVPLTGPDFKARLKHF